MSPESTNNDQKKLQLHVPQDLEYVYRDLFNVFASPTEVVVEFGNRHRSVPEQGVIADRIVLSLPTAQRLQRALEQSLTALQQQLQELQKKQG